MVGSLLWTHGQVRVSIRSRKKPIPEMVWDVTRLSSDSQSPSALPEPTGGQCDQTEDKKSLKKPTVKPVFLLRTQLFCFSLWRKPRALRLSVECVRGTGPEELRTSGSSSVLDTTTYISLHVSHFQIPRNNSKPPLPEPNNTRWLGARFLCWLRSRTPLARHSSANR